MDIQIQKHLKLPVDMTQSDLKRQSKETTLEAVKGKCQLKHKNKGIRVTSALGLARWLSSDGQA